MENNSLELNLYNDNIQPISPFNEYNPLEITLIQTDIDNLNDNKINKDVSQYGGNHKIIFKYKKKIFEIFFNKSVDLLPKILKKIKNNKQKSYTIYIKNKKKFIKHILYNLNGKLKLRKI